jgi:hypothetical protein
MKPSTTSCDDVLEMLPLHVGGDLEDASHRAVVHHLAGCATCRAAEARAAAVRRTLCRGLESEVRGGGPALWPGVRAALVRERVLAPRPGTLLRGPWWRAAVAVAAAAVVALLVLPRVLERGGERPTDLVDGGPPPIRLEVGDAAPDADGPLGDAPAVADAATAGTEPSPFDEAQPGGLVPVHDFRDLLKTQLGPVSDPRNRLVHDSPVR